MIIFLAKFSYVFPGKSLRTQHKHRNVVKKTTRNQSKTGCPVVIVVTQNLPACRRLLKIALKRKIFNVTRTLLAAKISAESLKIAVCFFGLSLLCSCHFWEITDTIS